MTDSHNITTTAPVQIERQSSNIHPLVELAMGGGQELDTDKLRELMALQREWQADQAKQSYTRAMVALKMEMPSVLNKDSSVDFTSSKGGRTHYRFTSLAHAIDVVSPHLAKHGFTITWTPKNTEKTASVTCRLTHCDGHYEETTMEAPHDNGAGKNAVQAIGSTVTYLQRYTALALLGIATVDMKEPHQSDDDHVDAAKNLQAVAALKQCGVTLEQACSHVGKDVRQWALADLEKLRELVRTNRQQSSIEPREIKDEESNEAEQLRVAVINKAIEKWGDDGMLKLSQIMRSKGTSIQGAGLDALICASEEIK